MESFVLYKNNEMKFKKISDDEMNDLFNKGTKEDLNKIFMGNMGLVTYVLDKYFYNFSNKEDLFSEGCIGLWKAVCNFDITKGNKFATYAVPMITGTIKRYINAIDCPIRVSRSTRDLARRIMLLQEEYSKHNYGKQLNIPEIAKLLNEKESDIKNAINSNSIILSLDEYLQSSVDKPDDDKLTLLDVINADKYTIEDLCEARDIYRFIEKKAKSKSEIHCKIICEYYGINTEKEKNQFKLAKKYNVSQSCISKTITKFKKEIFEELEYIKSDSIKPSSKKIPREKKKNIYEELYMYDKRLIDFELESLTKEQMELLKKKYSCCVLSNNESSKIETILKRIVFNLAMITVSDNNFEHSEEYVDENLTVDDSYKKELTKC